MGAPKVLILGSGRIGRAVGHYLKILLPGTILEFYPEVRESRAKNCDLLIGCLPGDLGELPLSLSLKYRKNLVDISDVEPHIYQAREKRLKNSAISVIPCCGFCPGLLNFILGRELSLETGTHIEISAGSLSRKKDYYPFLWCFEDLILEHRIPSWQIIGGRTYTFKPFDGYRRESHFGIESESYYAQSGFENMLKSVKGVKDFIYRVIRPAGFREFYRYMANEGFFRRENMAAVKAIAEANVRDNLTLARIGVDDTQWLIKSSARAAETINSMQKITALTPALMAALLLTGKLEQPGLLWMERLGTDEKLFKLVISENRKRGIVLQRTAG